jgi:chemotaxis protein MotB
MANRKAPPVDKEMMAPLWVVTYSDLISLLVTFFVLLFTFSSMDQDNFRRVSGSLSGGLGVMTEASRKSKEAIVPPSVPTEAKTDVVGNSEPPKRSQLEDLMNNRIQDPTLFDKQIDFSSMPDGYRVRLDGDFFLGPGSTRLTQRGRAVLQEVARMFQGEAVRLIVEAHTDPMTSAAMPGTDAMQLTRTVARDLARFLVEETGWEANRVGASGRGATVPIADNGSGAGRRKNRRIEIQVIWDPEQRGRL